MPKKIILLSLFISIFAGCSLNEPSLPDWETKWSLHLRPETYTMEEAINDTVITAVLNSETGDSILFISISDTTDPEGIAKEDRAFKAEDRTIRSEIGVISLDAPDPVQTGSVFIDQIFPEIPPIGTELPKFDPQTVEPDPQHINFNKFRSVTIESAEMFIVFHNALFLDINAGMQITVKNDVNDETIGIFVFSDPIPANTTSESEKLNLAGKRITNEMSLIYKIPLAGTSESITITQEHLDTYYYADVHMSAINVIQAEAIVPEQDFSKADSNDIDTEGKVINYATIEESTIYLNIRSQLAFSSDVSISLLNLKDVQDNPYIINTFLEKNSNKNLIIDDLDGYTLQHHRNPGKAVTQLYYIVDSRTISTENDPDPYVLVKSDDGVEVEFSMDSAYVSSFEGAIDETIVEIDPIEQNDILDASKIDGRLTLNDLVLTLNLHNEIGFDIFVELDIAGYHYDDNIGEYSDSVIIHQESFVNAGSSGQAEITVIEFDKNSPPPTIVDMMAILPTDLKISGKAIVEGEGSASANDKIWADYSIESPLTLEILEPIIFKGEIDSIGKDDLDEEEREDIDDHFTRIFAQLKVENGLPVGTNVKFFMGTDSTTLFDETITDSSQKLIIIENIDPGSVGANGFVDQPEEGSFTIELNDKQISLINNKQLFYATRVEILRTDRPVTFRKNDKIRVEPMLDIEVHMNPEDE